MERGAQNSAFDPCPRRAALRRNRLLPLRRDATATLVEGALWPFAAFSRCARLSRLADDDGDRGDVGGGARHILRFNAERHDPTEAQTYGYLSELFSSARHAELDPGLRFGQLQVLLLHYLALAEDGALPGGGTGAAWRRLPRPPFCDADLGAGRADVT